LVKLGSLRFNFQRFIRGKIFTGGLGMIGSIYDLFTLPGQVMEANIRRAFYEGVNKNVNPRPSWRKVDDGETHIVHDKDE
jgi:hypothetical protein